MRTVTLKIPDGYIIAIEGIDAVGKNTHSTLLLRWLTKKHINATRMSFPDYRTPIGRQIKSFLSGQKICTAELQHLLFAANRWEKRDEILSLLHAGELLIINRYTESNLAYGTANGLETDWLANLEKGMPKADLVLVLDAPMQSVTPRRSEERKDLYERSTSLQSKARTAYRRLAPRIGWTVIDARGSVAEVQKRLMKTVKYALARDRGVFI